jgi:hypothetical protein
VLPRLLPVGIIRCVNCWMSLPALSAHMGLAAVHLAGGSPHEGRQDHGIEDVRAG